MTPIKHKKSRTGKYWLSLLVFVSTMFAPVRHVNAFDAAPEPIRVRFTLRSRLPAIESSINGRSVLLLIDTGLYKSIALTGKTLQDVPVSFTGNVDRFRDAQGQFYTRREFTIATMSADELTTSEVEGMELFDMPQPYSGAIGLALLSKYTVVFDYPNSVMLLYPLGTRLKQLKKQCVRPFGIDVVKGVVQSRIKTDQGEFTFDWDTGSSDTMIRPSALGLGFFTNVNSAIFSKFKVGGRNLGRTPIPINYFAAPDVDGVLGTDFLSSRVFCLDVMHSEASIGK
jgi:hypothetical protein